MLLEVQEVPQQEAHLGVAHLEEIIFYCLKHKLAGLFHHPLLEMAHSCNAFCPGGPPGGRFKRQTEEEDVPHGGIYHYHGNLNCTDAG